MILVPLFILKIRVAVDELGIEVCNDNDDDDEEEVGTFVYKEVRGQYFCGVG